MTRFRQSIITRDFFTIRHFFTASPSKISLQHHQQRFLHSITSRDSSTVLRSQIPPQHPFGVFAMAGGVGGRRASHQPFPLKKCNRSEKVHQKPPSARGTKRAESADDTMIILAVDSPCREEGRRSWCGDNIPYADGLASPEQLGGTAGRDCVFVAWMGLAILLDFSFSDFHRKRQIRTHAHSWNSDRKGSRILQVEENMAEYMSHHILQLT